jgi:hypothetical protein
VVVAFLLLCALGALPVVPRPCAFLPIRLRLHLARAARRAPQAQRPRQNNPVINQYDIHYQKLGSDWFAVAEIRAGKTVLRSILDRGRMASHGNRTTSI